MYYGKLGLYYDKLWVHYGNLWIKMGIILLIKFIAVNLLLLIGALNKFRYVPMIETHPEKGIGKLYSSINYEIMLTIFVLILTSLLTTSFMLPMYNSTMYN